MLRRLRIAPGPALAVLLLTTAACRGEVLVDSGPGATVVTVATARTGELNDIARASGMIVPATSADVTIYAPEHAEIAELTKQVGDPVVSGDVLVRFDIASLNQEKAALELGVIEAQVRLDSARAALTRQTGLFERGIVARTAYDETRLEHAAAESGLASARSRLEALRSTQTRDVVRATFAGEVLEVWHQAGDAVRPGADDPIIRVIDPARVQVAVQLPVLELARVRAGQTATVRGIADATDLAATVVSKAQAVDQSAPTGEVRLAFVDDATQALDTPVSVEILLERRSNALIVPSAAIGRDDFGPFVMRAGDDGLAHRQDVRVGLVSGQLTQVTAGLDEGDRVILSGLDQVADQDPITISR